jgi:hypothetical protein
MLDKVTVGINSKAVHLMDELTDDYEQWDEGPTVNLHKDKLVL